MNHFCLRRYSPVLCLGLLAGFLFFYRLADRDLWSSHEARAAQDAQSILSDGCWGLPRLFDGHAEFQKPPLYYWLVALLGGWRGGVDAWTVRLPAALCGLGGVLVMYLFGSRVGRPIAGFVAAVILATAEHYTWLARVGRIDMPLTLAVTLALGGYYLGRRNASAGRSAWGWLLVAYLATAAALLLKGPIGVVLPLAVIFVHRLITPPPRRPATRSSLWWGVPLLLALVVPWYLWVGIHTDGQFYRVFFWYHNIERGLHGTSASHAHPFWFYGPRLAEDFLPWSPFLLLAGWFLLRRPAWRHEPEVRFGLVWLLSMTALLSCMRFKRADYLLPAFPGAALFLGCAAERWYRTAVRPRRLAAAFAVIVAGCAGGWWVYLDHVLPRYEPQREQQRFAAAIRQRAPSPQLVLFFRAEAHALAFHLGRPLDTFLEWENLNVWAGRSGCFYIVMPPECAAEWSNHVTAGRLEEVLRNTDLAGGRHEHPLVLMRTRPLRHGKELMPRHVRHQLAREIIAQGQREQDEQPGDGNQDHHPREPRTDEHVHEEQDHQGGLHRRDDQAADDVPDARQRNERHRHGQDRERQQDAQDDPVRDRGQDALGHGPSVKNENRPSCASPANTASGAERSRPYRRNASTGR